LRHRAIARRHRRHGHREGDPDIAPIE
jgi:hypothetical protein